MTQKLTQKHNKLGDLYKLRGNNFQAIKKEHTHTHPTVQS